MIYVLLRGFILLEVAQRQGQVQRRKFTITGAGYNTLSMIIRQEIIQFFMKAAKQEESIPGSRV